MPANIPPDTSDITRTVYTVWSERAGWMRTYDNKADAEERAFTVAVMTARSTQVIESVVKVSLLPTEDQTVEHALTGAEHTTVVLTFRGIGEHDDTLTEYIEGYLLRQVSPLLAVRLVSTTTDRPATCPAGHAISTVNGRYRHDDAHEGHECQWSATRNHA